MLWNAFLSRVVLALVLGALIGVERQWRQRMAGLRTNALVATGASLFVLLPELLPDMHSETARIAAQVVSGVGFLGAGVIMQDGLNVRGLNTAATLWCAAAVGVLSGLGLVLEACIAAGVVIAANVVLRQVATLINRQPQTQVETDNPYHLRIVCMPEDEVRLRSVVLEMLSAAPVVLRSLQSRDLKRGRLEIVADLVARPADAPRIEQIVSKMSLEKSVSAVSWKLAAEPL